jgi:hypothetical protein
VGQKSAVLLHVPDSPSEQHCGLSADILLAHHYFAPLRLDQSVEAAEQRGFARSAFSYQRYGVSRRNVNAHVVERDDAPEVMRDIPRSQGSRHALKSDSSQAQPLSPCPEILLWPRVRPDWLAP